ncbi:putative glucose-6-phosphate 1-epimerase isoform X2 [Manihot esculenta]|uniref:putative glucose-6-phosphate 1-epimerase isoform X2 n=1 Tax=Manihot esculenta TaxID=3983 RepID=UPI001CC6A7B9|nr:putative glucose-6-phosphate 1-epimerase isoform X2 [Manihot esculenta]
MASTRSSCVRFAAILPRSTCMEVKLHLGRMNIGKNCFLLVARLYLSLQRLSVEFGIGALERHGFARNRFWSIDNDPPPFPTNTSNKAFIDLILKHSEEDAKIWPHRYEFRLRITLGPGGDLMLTSRIRNTNTDGKSFTFTFAYHNNLYVTDISEVRVEGLETLDYLDNLKDRERFTEQGDAITFESEVDKLYLSTPTKIAVLDHERKRTFVLRKDGLPDADTWKGYRVIRFKFHFLSFNCWCKEDLQSIILNIPCSVEYGPIITMTPMSHSCCFKVTLCLRFAPYITNVSVWSTMAAEHELLEYVR